MSKKNRKYYENRIKSCKTDETISELKKYGFYFKYNKTHEQICNDIVHIDYDINDVCKKTQTINTNKELFVTIPTFYLITDDAIYEENFETAMRGHAFLKKCHFKKDIIATSTFFDQIIVLGPNVIVEGAIKGFKKVVIMKSDHFIWNSIDPDYYKWQEIYEHWIKNATYLID